MPTKVTVQINGPQGGWSENIYKAIALADLPESTWQSRAAEYVALRRPMLHTDCTIFAMRFSDAVNARKVFYFPQTGKSGSYPTGSSVDLRVDQLSTRLNLRYNLALGLRGSTFLGGLPDEVTSTANPHITEPQWVTRFQAWQAYLLSTDYGGYVINPATQFNQPILNMSVVAGKILVFVNDTTGLLTGQRVRISGAISEPDFNGRWRVDVLNGNEFTLFGSDTTLPNITYQADTGKALGQQRSFHLLQSAVQKRITKHNTGRPFGLSVGRRKKRQRRVPRIPVA